MLRKNIVASYVSQIYVTLVGILLLPIYIKYMGSEAYGLVGFFSMLQAWFGLLDLGLTPTIARESARYHGGAISALTYRQLYRALSVIFVSIASLGGGTLYFSSNFIATQWLNVITLSISDVTLAIQIMALCVALRWMCGLYRGVITGAEQLVWLSGFSVFIATLRFVVVLPVMWYWGYTPVVFFLHQLIIAMLEVLCFWLKASYILPNKNTLKLKIGWSFQPIKPVLKFALTIAFTASVWVAVTQTDKLILSGILTLEEYGYFTLAVLIANGITVISGPISSVIMPRMARLHAENKHDELIAIYKKATQLVVIIAGSAAGTIAIVAHPLLLAWTNDPIIAHKAAPILRLYAIGNGFLAIAAFPYYLQYAKGNLRYHLIGNLAMLVFLLPSIIIAAKFYGGIGAGYAWLVLNGIYLFTWTGYVHSKLVPRLHGKWLFQDVLQILLVVAFAVLICNYYRQDDYERLESLFYIVEVSAFSIFVALLGSSYFWGFIKAIDIKSFYLKGR
jgi:O-antigen/teichoic acid export membrane protein